MDKPLAWAFAFDDRVQRNIPRDELNGVTYFGFNDICEELGVRDENERRSISRCISDCNKHSRSVRDKGYQCRRSGVTQAGIYQILLVAPHERCLELQSLVYLKALKVLRHPLGVMFVPGMNETPYEGVKATVTNGDDPALKDLFFWSYEHAIQFDVASSKEEGGLYSVARTMERFGAFKMYPPLFIRDQFKNVLVAPTNRMNRCADLVNFYKIIQLGKGLDVLDRFKQIVLDVTMNLCCFNAACLTDDVKTEIDTLRPFIEDRLEFRDGGSIKYAEVYKSYEDWCRVNHKAAQDSIFMLGRLERYFKRGASADSFLGIGAK